ncbi:component of SufBCD complex [Rhodobacter sp. TJ_12]|uniref:component of SufBCD complex n=1 Tax=Rhodobacter sp. TJ_12 TaxID=2029399 RepID=UPI001CBED7A7|nr:component of SufBCD complex [Rhodobacter sp. TJ_12]MBZ4022503.1 component of SufBCD complex [Rhodobacter sp. TJ_12]
MNILQTVFDLIDMRSFSNLWYWIALAVTWSTASHWVLGVPFDMVVQARRKGGQAAEDMLTLTAVNSRRLLNIGREAGVTLSFGGSFLLSGVVVLGFVYGFEFAQAVALIAVPLAIVGAMSLRTAAQIAPMFEQTPDPEAVARMLARHRVAVQAVGLVTITITALWGMFQNLQLSVLR